MTERIRIVSDLHLGHKASLIEDLQALRPLAEGVDHLIFNGDTLELKYGDLQADYYNAEEQKARFDEEVASWGIDVTVITGNHDPAISEIHSASVCDGLVFVTHGDGLFRDIAPWSSNVKNLRLCSAHIDENETGTTAEALHLYLSKHKQATLDAHKLDGNYNPTMWGKLKIFLHQTWPPSTPFRILKCWQEMPGRAISLASRFALTPRFIVVGHTHNPGIWRRGDQVVVNLGSYFPWPGARCIDIDDQTFSVRMIKKGKNRIEIGRVIESFELRSATPSVSTLIRSK